MYRNDAVVALDLKIRLKIWFEKMVFLAKFYFYIKRSMQMSGNELLHFYQ